MRLKKGTKVEVLSQKEVPSGSWRCAEIIGGNGHNYTVRYDGDIGSLGKATIERVYRKAIRPCPPLVDVLEDWMPSDIVEVFHNSSWKMATVLKVSGRNHLLVRLLGSAIEFKANKYDVRARLCWQDGEWMVIGKASSKFEDLRFRLPSSRKESNRSQKKGTVVSRRIKGDHVSTRNVYSVPEPQAIPSRTLKRKPSYCHPEIEGYAERNQKIRVGKKHSTWRQSNVGCSRSMSLESDDDRSVSSSVGSCSVYGNYSYKSHHVFTAGPCEDNDHHCSDAESFCQLKSEEGTGHLPGKEELTEGIHRATVRGLYTLLLNA